MNAKETKENFQSKKIEVKTFYCIIPLIGKKRFFRAVINFTNILRAVFSSIFFTKKLQSPTVSREKLRKKIFYM